MNKKFKRSELKIEEGFYYDGIYGHKCLRLEIKNKKTGKIYKGVLRIY